MMRHPTARRGTKSRLGAVAVATSLAALACSLPGAGVTPTVESLAQPTVRPPSEPSARPPATSAGGVIFHNGVILTMDEDLPTASAIHIQGDRIVSLGDDAAVLAEAGAATQIVDLGGLTLMPGFVDTHNHIFLDLGEESAQAVLLENGVTTSAELYVDEALLRRLLELEAAAGLRIRLSAYLVYNSACGEPLGDWYTAYAPTRRPGEMLRIGGIKIFADGGSCNVPAVTFEYPGGYGQGDLYFTADELEPVLRQLDQAGWQVAVHALGDRAIDSVLEAYTRLLQGTNPRRHRIEHNAVLRPDQLPRYTQAGVVATIFGPFQTCITLGDRSRFRYLVPETHQNWEWPWRELLEANPSVHFAWHSDMPHVFGTNPAKHLYGLVTRNQIADDGTVCQAPEWLARNAIDVQSALRLMTLDAAYALERDDEVGSLTPGKYADLIVLSDNPLAIDASRLAELQVLMTIVGGRVEYCAEGSQARCPSAGPAQAAATASAPSIVFHDDFDGDLGPGWSWLEEDPAAWSLTANPGWLRIGLSVGGFLGGTSDNVLLRPPPDGDFEVSTLVRVAPARNFEFAGLVIIFDDDTIVQFGRAFCDLPGCAGDGYYFDNLVEGTPVDGNFATAWADGGESLLRLVRRGNAYTASFLAEDGLWIEVGQHTVELQPTAVGLLAAQATAPGASAEFDWFEVNQP